MVDRPLECIGCKNAVAVVYKEIKDGTLVSCIMCQDCPILKHKLYGRQEDLLYDVPQEATGLCCSKCGTNLTAVRRGELLGCSECYQVFDDFLAESLLAMGKIPSALKELIKKKNYSLHIGKTPKQTFEAPISSKLATLMEALNDALKKENYEQAAWLRDQIAELKDKNYGRTQEPS